MSPLTPSTFSCHSVMLCIVLLLAHHIQPVNSHYYGSCIGSRDRSKAEASVCTTDDIYVYVNTNHGMITDGCYSAASQARVSVTGSGVTTFDKRPTLNTVGASSDWASIPNCLGATVTGSRTNMICKANGMQPHHCSGSQPNWFRYGPISKNGATTLTVSVYGMGCDSGSSRRTWNFTPKLCRCTTTGQGLSNSGCSNCGIGQSADNGISSCAPCTGGKYQNQGAASAWGCKTCGTGKVTANKNTACSNCPTGQSQEKPQATSYVCNKCGKGKIAASTSKICMACTAGQYQGSNVATSHACTACSQGKYATSGSVTACSGCGIGRFQDLTSAVEYQCKPCTQGRYENGGSSALCKGCPVGTNLMDVGATASSQCTDCIAGLYNPFEGHQSACLACPSGQTARAIMCAGCNPGKKQKSSSDSSCVDCASGQFSDERDLLACKQCPKAYYTNDVKNNDGDINFHRCQGCPRGTWGDQMATVNVAGCKACTAGLYNDAEGSMVGCKNCPKGKYSPTSSNVKDSDCQNCISGQYSTTVAAQSISSCVDCIVSKYSESVGASAESTCKKCALGMEQKLPGMSYCLPCTPGSKGIANSGGFSICETCGNNFYQSGISQTICLECPKGRTSDMGSVSCSLCPAGWFVDNPDVVVGGVCKACLKGTYQPGMEKDGCIDCPSGKISSNAAAASCDICNNGVYMNITGQWECEVCKNGQFKKEQLFEGNPYDLYTCKDCDVGRYQNEPGQASCFPCIPGTYNDEKGEETACKTCLIHEYRGNEDPATVCLKCPKGWSSSVGSAVCNKCGAGNYGDVLGGGCKECDAGKRRDVTDAPTICIDCVVGQYQNLKAQSSCLPCIPGTYMDVVGEAVQCKECNAGEISISTKSTGCVNCVAGQYQNLKAQSSCLPCIPGTYMDDAGEAVKCKNCLANKYRSNSMIRTICVDCPQGWLSTEGSAKCGMCGSGNFGDTIGGGCQNCVSGQFRGASDPANTCIDCAEGYFQSLVASASCLPCIPGLFMGDLGASLCTDCAVQTFTDATAQASCKGCPNGYLAVTEGSASCQMCVAGRAGATCAKCLTGQYRASGIALEDPTVCLVCPAGWHQDNEGQASCLPCSPGSFNGQESQPSCTDCETGKMAAVPKSTVCSDCLVGRHQNIVGQASCLPCIPGKAINDEGSVECDVCAKDTYSASTTATSCDVCAIGRTTLDATGSTSCTICAAGTFGVGCKNCITGQYRPGGDDGSTDATKCIACPAGYHQSSEGQASCLPCAPGTANDNTSQALCTECELGTFAKLSKSLNCAKCIEGFHQNTVGQASCLPCVPGKANNVLGKVECDFCLKDTFTASTIETSCTTCDIGRTTDGATGATNCQICAAGRFGKDCDKCAVGQYRKGGDDGTTDATKCVNCPTGFHQDTTGQASCLPCSPGSANDIPGSEYCTKCEEKYFSNVTELVTCFECPVGKRSLFKGAASCVNCIAGRYGKTCEKCEMGWFRAPTDEDATICKACAPGLFQGERGGASCQPCSPGTSNPTFAAVVCPYCPNGQYTFSTKTLKCKQCQLGRGTIRNGSAFCTPCAKGKFSTFSTNGTCSECSTGLYQDKEEQSNCLNCPAGYLSGTGAVECKKPEIADPEKLPPPAPPLLSSMPRNASLTCLGFCEGDDSLQLSWEYQQRRQLRQLTAAVPPDGFLVRLSTTRDFEEEEILPQIEGKDNHGVVVTFEKGVSTWLLEEPVYMQVSSYILGGGVDVYGDPILPIQSEWSTATESWILAYTCKDNEYLDNNTTDPTTWTCELCPDGASCIGPKVWKDVRPLAGYWRVPWDESVFERCPYVNDCLGYDVSLRYYEQKNISSDGCVYGTTGVLCSQCVDGFNRDVSVCLQCSPESFPMRVGILVAAVLLILLILSACKRRLNNQWRRFKPLYRDALRIGSIVITFSQINTSMPHLFDIKWPEEFVEFLANFNVVNIDLFALVGVSCIGNFDFYIGFLAQSCLPVLICLWALFDLWHANKKMNVKVTKMTEADKNLANLDALHMLYHITDADGEGTISPNELSHLLHQLGWNASIKQSQEIMIHFHDDGSKEWTNETGQLVITEEEFVASMISGKMKKIVYSQKILRVGATLNKKTGEIIHTSSSKKESLLCDRDHIIRWILGKRIIANSLAGATMLALLAHTPVSRKVFQFFHCNNIAGEWFLRADYTIRCWSLGWWAFSPAVFTVLGVFTCCLPGGISLYLYRRRDRLYTADVQQKVGWLYTPFRKGSEFWMIHDVIFKMILTGLLIYVPESARASVALMVSVGACCTLNYFIPHKNRILFWLTQLSFVCVTFKYICALMLRVDYYSDEDIVIGYMLIILDITFMTCALICMIMASCLMRKKLKKYRSVKNKMRVLLKSASSMSFGNMMGEGKLKNWKIAPMTGTPDHDYDEVLEHLATNATGGDVHQDMSKIADMQQIPVHDDDHHDDMVLAGLLDEDDDDHDVEEEAKAHRNNLIGGGSSKQGAVGLMMDATDNEAMKDF